MYYDAAMRTLVEVVVAFVAGEPSGRISRAAIITKWESHFCGYGKLHLLLLVKCHLPTHLIGSERSAPPCTTDAEVPIGPKVWENPDMPLAMIAGFVMVLRTTLSDLSFIPPLITKHRNH